MKRFAKPLITCLALGSIVAAVGSAAIAADAPDKVIAYRKAVMGSLGAHITAISSVVKGETSYVGHVSAHASAMAAAAGMIPDIFPEGTGEGDTRAKPEIWQDWAKFEKAAQNLQAQATKLAEVASGGDVAAIGAQLGEVGKACGGCHEPFRKKEKQ